MSIIQLFLQFEGNKQIELIEIDSNGTVSEILAAAHRAGLCNELAEGALVFGFDGDEPLNDNACLASSGIGDKHRVHVHRCRRIEVTVNFNEHSHELRFPPSATVERVKARFVRKFELPPVDATEHVLQLCGCTERPEPDTQIGALVSGCCSLCFDLVPIKRVEG